VTASQGQSNLVGKLLLKGELVCETPLIMGSGDREEESDLVVLKDEHGKPFIPATAFVGALRQHFFRNVVLNEVDREQIAYFWGAWPGAAEKDLLQSAFSVQDLYPVHEVQVKVRDGVRIDPRTSTATERAKYDYEVVEPPAVFCLKAEVTLRAAFKKEWFIAIIQYLIQALEQGKISLGAMTTKGFGRCRLKNPRLNHYDYTNKEAVLAWFGEGDPVSIPIHTWDGPVLKEKEVQDFFLDAHFLLRSSLIVRKYIVRSNEPDAEHITSQGKPVLPGTSIKGALRNRAEAIVNTLGGRGQEQLKQLFGWVDLEEKTKEKYKSRLIVEETVVENAVLCSQQRIRIDRFTGSTMHNALFDEKPVWSTEEGHEQVRIKLRIRDCASWEAGLMLLLLKDLWTGDLPLGGEKSIGRGTLQGLRAEIAFGSQWFTLEEAPETGLKVTGNRRTLEEFVAAFVREIREGGQQHGAGV